MKKERTKNRRKIIPLLLQSGNRPHHDMEAKELMKGGNSWRPSSLEENTPRDDNDGSISAED